MGKMSRSGRFFNGSNSVYVEWISMGWKETSWTDPEKVSILFLVNYSFIMNTIKN